MNKSDSGVYARMLYDHEKDPQENINISEKPEKQQLVDQLQKQLHNQWGEDFNR